MIKQLLVALLLSYSSPSLCQHYFYNGLYYDNTATWEAGITIGIMNCLTDLGGRTGSGKPFIKDLNWNQAQFCTGLYTSLLYQYFAGARLEAAFGRVAAADRVIKPDNSAARHRYRRNLHFRSRIAELSLTTEFHPLTLLARQSGKAAPLLSPYLLAGVGLFHFRPEANSGGQWVSLPGLHTEGQGFKDFPYRLPYKLTQVNFPVGVGLKYELSALLNIRIEIIHRILSTDYLDDVSNRYIDPALFYTYLSPDKAALAAKLADRRNELNVSNNAPVLTPSGSQRGNPQNNDAYFSVVFKIGFILNRQRK